MNEAKLNSSLLGKWPNFPQNVNRLIGILKGCVVVVRKSTVHEKAVQQCSSLVVLRL